MLFVSHNRKSFPYKIVTADKWIYFENHKRKNEVSILKVRVVNQKSPFEYDNAENNPKLVSSGLVNENAALIIEGGIRTSNNENFAVNVYLK